MCLGLLLALALPRAVSAQEDPRIASLLEQAVGNYKAVLDETKAYLKQQDQKSLVVPEPPSLELECNEHIVDLTNTVLVEHYINEASDPEFTLIRRLFAARRTVQMLSNVPLNQLLASGRGRKLMEKNPADYPETYTYEMKLLVRLKEKVRKLMATYKGKPDKLLAIHTFALVVNKSIALVKDIDAQFLAELGAWDAGILKVLMEKLVKEHDYRQVEPIVMVARLAALVGSEDPAVMEAYERLDSALTFRLEATYTLDEQEWRWITKSQFAVHWVTSKSKAKATGAVSAETTAGAGGDEAAKAETEAAKAAKAEEKARDARAKAAFEERFGAVTDAERAAETAAEADRAADAERAAEAKAEAAGESKSERAWKAQLKAYDEALEKARIERAEWEEAEAAKALWRESKEEIAEVLREKVGLVFAGSGEAKARFAHKTAADATGRAPEFTVLAKIEKIDACSGTATLIVDRFSPDGETYTHCGESKGGSLLSAFWDILFASGKAQGASSFPVKLNNLSETAIDQTVDGGVHGPVSGSFAIKLIHKPGK